MLHEILLGLSGHPSPLLRTDRTSSDGSWPISPAERELLGSVAHLSDVHIKLLSSTAQISSSHPSTICRAVASAIDSIHLRAFQQKVVQVEESILRNDAGLVGAYNIVPLTAIVGEFSDWTRRMDWLWALVQFILRPERAKDEGAAPTCTGARIINRLRKELQTGYVDIEEAARRLVQVAEIAWLKQVSAWILYGRLPSFGQDDFFVQRCDDVEEEYECIPSLQPSFVTTPTALSMLFVGRSLIHIRAKSRMDGSLPGTHHLSSQLKELSTLTYPLDGATFSRTITNIRLFLSRTTLQKLLPQSKVLEMLQILRDFFLLGRGDFAMALTQQADQKIRSRWRRADNLAYEKREGLANVTVKEGEAAAVLAATWAALGSWQGQHSDEDEGLEMARGLLQLSLTKPDQQTPLKPGPRTVSSTPFRNLLFSVPVTLTMQIPSPIDLFLSPSDLQLYTMINSYLLSIRRAHIRLTDLWKISPLRRHHPPPPAPPYGSSRNGRAKVLVLRERHISRSNEMRSAWATCSAAIFFLAETEAYLQTEVVAGLWDGFQRWLTTGTDDPRDDSPPGSGRETAQPGEGDEDGDDIWLATATSKIGLSESEQSQGGQTTQASYHHHQRHHRHDPQTLTAAHRLYLGSLAHRLLLTQQSFTDALYELLVHIDHLIALVHRLHGIWTSIDLEADAGVVDAFVDLEREERDVKREIKAVEARVRKGVQGTVELLRSLEGSAFLGSDSGLDSVVGNEMAGEEGAMELREFGEYAPRRVGGLDRLLMKLDFGSWFDSGRRGERGFDDDEL